MTIDYAAVKTILEQLSKVSSIEVQMIFYRMLQDKKVDFNTLSNAYVKYLEEENVDEMLFKPECTTSDKFEYTSAIEDNTKDVTTYNINSTITYC